MADDRARRACPGSSSRSLSASGLPGRRRSRRCSARAWRWSRRPRPISTATAARIPEPGRAGASLAYATESMRLTTRLMQLASWLLLQRAVNEGEMTADQANSEKSKVKLGGLASATGGPGWDDLPERLRTADPPLAPAAGTGAPARRRASRRTRSRRQIGNPVARQIGQDRRRLRPRQIGAERQKPRRKGRGFAIVAGRSQPGFSPP